MAAIGKAALSQVGQKFGDASFYRSKVHVMQAEQLHAGAVYEIAVCVQMIQTRVRGGVFAGIEYGGNFPCRSERAGDEGVDEGGFPHARLADQHAGVALQIGQ